MNPPLELSTSVPCWVVVATVAVRVLPLGLMSLARTPGAAIVGEPGLTVKLSATATTGTWVAENVV